MSGLADFERGEVNSGRDEGDYGMGDVRVYNNGLR